MSQLRTLDELGELRDRRVFVRVDFNVPIDGGKVLDTTRLDEALPTLDALSQRGARLVLASHRGRPKGRRDENLSLRPVAAALAGRWGRPVAFAEDCVGEPARRAVDQLAAGEAVLLENLRFHGGEKASDLEFVARLAELADVFVGDAFGSAHRAHASVVGVAKALAARAAGLLIQREVAALSRLLEAPGRPFVAVLGGAKIEGKMDTLVNLLPKLDAVLVGGGMANTFLAARGHDLGSSLVEADRLDLARDLLAQAQAADAEMVLPSDLVVTDDLGNPQIVETVDVDHVTADRMAVDVGPETRQGFARRLESAATVFWNGPLGVFETPPFDAGTTALAEALVAGNGFTAVGGGETVAAVRRAGVADRVGHVSTGGGASLELLAGKALPGVEVLRTEST
ncbi:MAG: phosphoglycerate kinase [Acidobacteriota bacterium]